MLIQIDGSYHRWLGEDGPQFMLLLAVDDATGKVVSALFCEYENTRDYFVLMRGLIERHGVPIALYTDRHSVFKHRTKNRSTEALQPSSPVRWTSSEYRCSTRCLHRPRAVWNERQAPSRDRLVTELRLAGCDHHRRCWCRSERLPSSLQRALRGIGSGV